jgi:hypothetical protein
MTQAGYTVTQPDDAIALAQKLPRAANSTGPSASELNLGVSDLACQLQDLIPTRQKLEIAQIDSLVARFPQYSARAQGLESMPDA